MPNGSFEEYQLNISGVPQSHEGVSSFIEELIMLLCIILGMSDALLASEVFQELSSRTLSTRNILPLEHVPIYYKKVTM